MREGIYSKGSQGNEETDLYIDCVASIDVL